MRSVGPWAEESGLCFVGLGRSASIPSEWAEWALSASVLTQWAGSRVGCRSFRVPTTVQHGSVWSTGGWSNRAAQLTELSFNFGRGWMSEYLSASAWKRQKNYFLPIFFSEKKVLFILATWQIYLGAMGFVFPGAKNALLSSYCIRTMVSKLFYYYSVTLF